MPPAPSLAVRALLALCLIVTFYLLALALAAGLLFIPYAEWAWAHRVHPKLALVCLVGAGAILWSICPRIERFEAPGPRLRPEEQPALFALIAAIARDTGQPPPVEVYLIPDVNAWVGQRGGFAGVGSRRIMGLGLPLLQALAVSHLRAVLAHEFGHYYGGDTKLGPWIYGTRAAILRTVAVLGAQDSVLRYPFVGYAKLFLRVTHAVSRRQEASADRLAARVAGAAALCEGLRRTHAAALAYEPYWSQEVVPVLCSGRRPPLAEGFARFLGGGLVTRLLDEAMQRESAQVRTDPYDTHPGLGERIAAVMAAAPRAAAAPADDPPAVSLLTLLPRLETGILASYAGPAQAASLRPIAWPEVGVEVWIPVWRNLLRDCARVFGGLTPSSVPDALAQVAAFAGRFEKPADPEVTPADREHHALSAVGAALALALHAQGWELCALPGEVVSFRHGATVLQPFAMPKDLVAGKLTAEAWRAQVAAAGIAAVDLGGLAAGPGPGA